MLDIFNKGQILPRIMLIGHEGPISHFGLTVPSIRFTLVQFDLIKLDLPYEIDIYYLTKILMLKLTVIDLSNLIN